VNTHRYPPGMSQRRGRLTLVLLTLLAPLLVAACSGGPAAPALPNATELLSHGADAMRTVKSAALDISVEPQVTAVIIRSATGHITSDGKAEGTAVLTLGGTAPLEYQLVVTDGVLYLKGPTGGFTPLPLASAASIYDPTAILDPDKGAAAMLAAGDKGQTVGRETVDGVDAYKVAATFPAAEVATMVPGVTAPVPGTVWLDAATNRLVRVELALPDGPTGKGGPVTVKLSQYDAPVTITAPV
jgi:lipoprotein LprG